MTLLLLMVSLRALSWALSYFFCILLMTSVMIANSLTFTFLKMILIYFMPIAVYLNWRSLLIIILKFKISFQLAYGKKALLKYQQDKLHYISPLSKANKSHS